MRFKNKMFALLVVFCSAVWVDVLAQTTAVHFDKPTYVTGEVVWYNLYLPESFKSVDLVVQVKIVDGNGMVIDRYFLKSVKKSQLSGYYKIPYDVLSGIYHFQFYLTEIQSFKEQLLWSHPISIVNDINTIDPSALKIAKMELSPGENQLDINVSVAQTSTTFRSSMPLMIKVSDKFGNPVNASLSISVVEEEALKYGSSVGIKKYEGLPAGNFGSQIYVKGKVVNAKGEGLKTNVMGAYSGHDGEMFYTKSDNSGEYILKLPDYTGVKPIQLIGYLFDEHSAIKVITSEQVKLNSIETQPLTDDFLKFVSDGKDRKKIYQSFNSTETQLKQEEIKRQVKKLKPNSTFVFKEYKKFDNVASFFNELLNSNIEFLKDKNGSYSARMYNPQARGLVRHFEGDPIFIIDGKVTRNADFVGKFSQDNMERAELFFITKDIRDQFGTFGNSAIVVLYTNLPNIEIPDEDADDIIAIKGIQPKASFDAITSDDLKIGAPIFRSQLYWNPSVKTDANGQANIQILQSDDATNFRIRVVAQSAEGLIGTSELTYSLKSELK